ncbi:MAG: NTP transferase domain-containing protein [Bacteroidota bacterium]
MAATVRCGVRKPAQKGTAVQRTIFMACDQPFVNAVLLYKLVTLQKEKGYAIVSARCAETIGILTVLDKQLFPGLLQIAGNAGAKKFIRQQHNAESVDLLLGKFDNDKAANYSMLKKF